MIKSHPAPAMLHSYICGDLSAAAALVVAAHIEFCPHCQGYAAQLEDQQASKELAQTTSITHLNMQQMLESIINSEPPPKLQSVTKEQPELLLENRRFKLPSVLARQQHRIKPWSKMPGKLWKAGIELGTTENMSLIYLDSHTAIPEHTHKGTELQLVLHGSFSDEFGSYSDGDLILLDGSHRHTPRTNDEDCLILAVLDAPLHFTSGISRLLNPFSALFFR